MLTRELKPIESDVEYRKLLSECEVLAGTDPDPDSPDGRRLLKLAVAVEAWEKIHFPIRDPEKAKLGS